MKEQLYFKESLWRGKIFVATGSSHPAVRPLPEKEQEQFVFQNAAELYATVQELGGNPAVEDKLPPGKSRAELNAAIETTISRVWSQIKEARAKKLTMPGM